MARHRILGVFASQRAAFLILPRNLFPNATPSRTVSRFVIKLFWGERILGRRKQKTAGQVRRVLA